MGLRPIPRVKNKWGNMRRMGRVTFSFACRTDRFNRPIIRVRHRPHTPLLGMINGVVRGWILCGEQRLCEHLLPDKPASSTVCGNSKFHSPSIRV